MARGFDCVVVAVVRFIIIHGLILLSTLNLCSHIGLVHGSNGVFPIVDSNLITGDDLPPCPPSPLPPSLSCEEGLGGSGSLNTSCQIHNSLVFEEDVYISGEGSLDILPGVSLSCLVFGCTIAINISGHFGLGENSSIVTSTFVLVAYNASLLDGSSINTTGLAGTPPPQTTGTPQGINGAGGGYGGRGARCLTDKTMKAEDHWGGDTYSWSSVQKPCSYGSRGGTTSSEKEYGGGGGGRVKINIIDSLDVNGTILAEGGDGGLNGGGGSGGSIQIVALKLNGNGKISSSGGNGLGGGGGGRLSIHVLSRHANPEIMVHGGRSYGCPENSGAAGTLYDSVPRSLVVSNNNMSTQTDTLLYEFPRQPLWTSVYIRNNAKAALPLLWSRVQYASMGFSAISRPYMQVRGQLSLLSGGVLVFGLSHYSQSEFELMAEELLMSDSKIEVYGSLRMSVKMFLMWNSQMIIDGGGDASVATSLLEASNLAVLRESSVIRSNANLGVHGQGLLNLSGQGDRIEAQRLALSLFYSIQVGPGSVLRGPLENATTTDMTPRLYCEHPNCPMELLHPPEDCNINSSMSFTLQICRVEDIIVQGLIKGSVIHFHWVRTVNIQSLGEISASGLGCTGGVGRGEVLSSGIGGGGGHGGKGGSGFYNGSYAAGGVAYGNADLPCELGSGSGGDSLNGSTSGGGVIVMGSLWHSLSNLSIYGKITANGESVLESGIRKEYRLLDGSYRGFGGGSGGTILLFLETLSLSDVAVLSTSGGHGSYTGGGGGGGGRIHFHWSSIPSGEKYQSLASVNGKILTRGGTGKARGLDGETGTVTGKACPKGLYGTFCEECPTGTFKNVSGSDQALCRVCPSYELPHRAIYTSVRGGVAETPCPYKCISDRYHMPHCYTFIEDVVHTFGGPWVFGLLLSGLLILLAIMLSVARLKFVGVDDLPGPKPTQHGSQIDHSFPFLESLNEVMETNRAEESQSHMHRIYFLGPNTFGEPWQLPRSPPEQIQDIVYEDAYSRFVDDINALAFYPWWEGSVYSILCILAYPLAYSWQEWCRKQKFQQLREFVRSEYDHSCLRSCRSRALYEGLKVSATSDLMLGYLDFFLGGDEKRSDLPPPLNKRLPMCLVFGGDGTYMTPFSVQSDNVLTSLMSQAVPPTIWYRFIAGLNAQLRLVCHGHLRTSFLPVVNWLESHANPALRIEGVCVDLVCWFQATSSSYCQYGLVVSAVEEGSDLISVESVYGAIDQQPRTLNNQRDHAPTHLRRSEDMLMCKRIGGRILDAHSLRIVEEKKNISDAISFIVHNTKPVRHQDIVGLVISVLLLGDFGLVLLTLLQFYSLSWLDFFLVLFILPLGILSPFPAGISALFSHGPKRSADRARIYALWNFTSLINVIVAFICGFVNYKTRASSGSKSPHQPWNFSMEESGWWMFPCGLFLCKCVQARLIDWHVANLEIQDRSLYANNPNLFWQS